MKTVNLLHMEEPKCCDDCPISAYGEYCCQVLEECPGDAKEMKDRNKRPSWCPLEPETDTTPDLKQTVNNAIRDIIRELPDENSDGFNCHSYILGVSALADKILKGD